MYDVLWQLIKIIDNENSRTCSSQFFRSNSSKYLTTFFLVVAAAAGAASGNQTVHCLCIAINHKKGRQILRSIDDDEAVRNMPIIIIINIFEFLSEHKVVAMRFFTKMPKVFRIIERLQL
jgi:hypothetical protein